MGSVERHVLLNPGPATTSDSVKQALVMTDICPREEAFCNLYAAVREKLTKLVGDPALAVTIPIVGSGTTALEATLSRLIPADGHVIIVENGDYGVRIAQIAKTLGISHRVVAFGFGNTIDLALLESILEEEGGRATHLYVVHHETSSGLLNPLPPLAAIARKHGLRLFLDAMSSFACLPMRLDGEDGVDVIVSSSNKCVQGMAGLGLIMCRRDLLEDVRAQAPRSFVLDLVAEYDHLEKTGQSRFTVPPQLVSALHQALLELEAETLEGRERRYKKSMQTLVSGLRNEGFELVLDDDVQSGILVAVHEPEAPWYDFRDMHDAMFEQGFTIYPGKPGKTPAFRLAVLGDIDHMDIEAFLVALRAYVGGKRG